MGLWKSGIERSRTGQLRKEEDLTSLIGAFFEGQHYVESYKISQSNDNKWVVNVKGSIHLHDTDLDDGNLFFTIGSLTGDLVCYCSHLKPSVIPSDLGGEIVFMKEEEQTGEQEEQDEAGLMGQHYLSTAAPSPITVRKKAAQVISDIVNHKLDIDFEDLIRQIKEEQEKRDKYKLVVKLEQKEGRSVYHCDIYLSDCEGEQPLDLTAMQKAVYLAAVCQDDGVTLEDIESGFLTDVEDIYDQLPEKVIGETSFFTNNDPKKLTITLNAYRSKIRDSIKERVLNNEIIDDFSIEGYKGEKVRVRKSTPEVRELIRRTFGLEQ